LAPGAIVVLESTVYPGVTEGLCGAELGAASRLEPGRDFFLGYSPERINPGDRQHTIERVTKVVAGQTPAVTNTLRQIYGAITNGNVFVARDIKTAEAAKIIENAQRDINIAFINEITMIFNKLDMSIYDVLDASRTKWNFLPFTPGLVGGHCIGVDPFYLADLARRLKHEPAVILAGRRINDGMGSYIANEIGGALTKAGKSSGARILVLGLAFKEDVPDLRNSRVADMLQALRKFSDNVDVHDPIVDRNEAREEYKIDLLPDLGTAAGYDAVIGAVPHRVYREFSARDLVSLISPEGLVADIKGMWRHIKLTPGIKRWQL
jgi:UDP-N-acetyl-D-galactosamine dehydrogenase